MLPIYQRLTCWAFNSVYLVVLVVCAPLIVWAALTKGKYRNGFAEKLLGNVPRRDSDSPCVWIHAVSVGEVNLLATTIAELRSRRPEVQVVLSSTTKTGYDLACRKYGSQHAVFYCPLDFSWAVRRAMCRIRPELLILAELELWPNLIAAAKQQGAKVAIINGRLSDNSFRGYRRAGWFVSRVLRQIDLIAAQDEATAERFCRLRVRRSEEVSTGKTQAESNVIVTGSLKYDGAETNRKNVRTEQLRELAGLSEYNIVWLAGSTQAPEEAMAVRIFQQLVPQHPSLRLVIVPRHPERFDEVARLLDAQSWQEVGSDWCRRSQLPRPDSSGTHPGIILVDTVGELGAWWGLATIGFVGGSFGDRGGQNMIEPAAYGVATCFGPNTKNFRDIVAALKAADAAQQVNSEDELHDFVAECLQNLAQAERLGARAKQFVATQLGATLRTVDLLESLLPKQPNKQAAAA